MFELAWLSPNQHLQLCLQPGNYELTGKAGPTVIEPIRSVEDRANSEANSRRIVIDDPWLDCPQLMLSLLPNGSIKIENQGRPILLPSGRRINAGQSQTLATPSQLVIGKTRLSLTRPIADWIFDQTLAGLSRDLDAKSSKREKGMNTSPAASTLVQWFDALNRLQGSQVGSQAFYDHAVQCTFDPGGLDLGLLLKLENEEWQIVASHVPFPEYGFAFRREIVERVAVTGKLWYHVGSDDFDALQHPDAQWVVAAPIMDQSGKVTSVLYAVRFESSFNKRHGIRPLEAHFVRLVADTISAASRRMQAQAEAARAHVLLEQTFSPQVVPLLERDPQLLDSRENEVTILFADLRGFSTMSEKLGAGMTHQLLADILNRWTRTIQARQGVVIDYYGDGLAAFWNAPVPTPGHAWLTCQTAWQMLDDLEIVNENWRSKLHCPLQVGIGINTGRAQVGNSGSQGKLKYGPRGHEVNLASRLENATKRFGVPILISEATANRVEARCLTLRLCRTWLPGIESSQNVFQLLDRHPNQALVTAAQNYAAALEEFEAGRFDECLEKVTQRLIEEDGDRRLDYLLEQLELVIPSTALRQRHPRLRTLAKSNDTASGPVPFQAWHAVSGR
ncbi:MAG: adenylate/guanylate cyclase domain-containing protein [Planctomycetaceae bacterium]|nr:adenylate/guanylate cyclase domain-containing protein [Planctomycetaceae bacterium]